MDERKRKFIDRYQGFIVEPSDYDILDEDHLDRLGSKIIFKAKEHKTRRIVYIQSIEDDSYSSIDDSKSFLRELELYIKVKSYIGIPTFYGYYFAPGKSIITEHFPNKNLVKFYAGLEYNKPKYYSKWNDTFKAQLTFGIACTMMHLHAFNIIHKYLSPEFIYFDEKYNPKITEFTLSKTQDDDIYQYHYFNQRITISNFYNSPEVLQNEKISSKSDVYSFGVILLSIVQGNERFQKDKNFSLVIPNDTPAFVSSIIKNCLNKNPERRPSFAQIVKALIDYQPLFPETNEDDYRICVYKYMQNVETARVDKHVLYGKNKKTKKQAEDNENQNESQKKNFKFCSSSSSSKIKSSKKVKSKSDEDEDENESQKKSSKFCSSSSKATSNKKVKSDSDEEESNKIIELESDVDGENTKLHSSTNPVIVFTSETSDSDENFEDDKSELSDSDNYIDPNEVIDTFDHSQRFTFVENQYEHVLEKVKCGDAYSMVQAGLYLQKGEFGVKVDKKAAFEMYEKAAKKGNVIGIYNYATCKMTGFGTDIDEDEAYRAMMQAAQPDKKSPQAMDTYGEWLLKKNPNNKKEALHYFLNSMKYGSSRGIFNAAQIYESLGEKEEAKRLYQEAGELGIYSAYNNYALMLLDDNETVQQGILVLKQNAIRKNPESNYNLGCIELEGKYGVDQNIEDGVKNIRSAAHENNERASFAYAKMLATGENGVKKDKVKALHYYKISAEKGNTNAMVNLGVLLQKDIIDGVEQDLEQAAEWFKKAADKGNTDGMEKYAKCLEEGIGVEKNADLAEEYKNKAKKKK